MNRAELAEQILGCRRCELYATCISPVPFAGEDPCDVLIVGEAPGREENKEGKPFVGPPGRYLRDQLTAVGITTYASTNAVCCYPTNDEGKVRTPTEEEVRACRPNLLAQIKLFQPRWIALAGATALQAIRPDLRIGVMHGRPFLLRPNQPTPICFPIYHPAAAARNPPWERALRADLSALAALSHTTKGEWALAVSDTCTACGVVADPWTCDDQGVPYCRTHLPPKPRPPKRRPTTTMT